MIQMMSAASLPLLTFLRPMALSRRHQPFCKLQVRLPRQGCIIESMKGSNALEAVTCKSAGVIEERRQKVHMLSAVYNKYMQQYEIILSDAPKAEPKELPKMIEVIRAALKSMGDGEISISAYDTAWVALVKKQGGGDDGPQFPLCIDWILQNQLPDGSWGDDSFFFVQDRIISTLACIIALKSWKIHEEKCKKGLSFICENMWRLKDYEDWMLIGFEITLPTLIEMAKNSGLEIPYKDPALQFIYAKRDLKLAKISKDVLHTEPTTLLFNMEGMPCLDWKRLLKFQSPDGSIAASPASTAYALMQTNNKKCLAFLDGIVNRFNGGAPYIYPVDIFERLWAADRLERLGISKYYASEMKECLDYVYRLWTQDSGLPSLRDFPVNDVDATAMGFRLLRLHGYHVSQCVFTHFEKDGEFFCFPRQSNQSVTAMYNLYRASQVAFPGEDELKRANIYCHAFLEKRRDCGTLKDKWLIAKDIPGEVGYALDFPWKASLPRIETRMYLEQYGGSNDVWIGKSLYRMPLVNNDMYLETAQADFRDFQMQSQLEWNGLRKWCDSDDLRLFRVSPQSALRAYFLAAANIFEKNRSVERIAWARTAVVAEAISWHMQCNAYSDNKKEGRISRLDKHGRNELTSGPEEAIEKALLYALPDLVDLSASGNASCSLHEAWKQWVMAISAKETHETCEGSTALLLVHIVEICSGRHSLMMEQNVNMVEYSRLERLIFSICSKLASSSLQQKRNDQNGEEMEGVVTMENMGRVGNTYVEEVELEMQELAQCVLQSCSSISWDTRQTFLHVAKSYYYLARCSPETVDNHISKVLFEDVVAE